MKPINKKDSQIQNNFANPHDIFLNADEAKRISKKRNKRNRSRAIRKYYKDEAMEQETELENNDDV